jgi:hypothetical protein
VPVVRKKKGSEHHISGNNHSSDSDNDVHDAQETCTGGDLKVIAGFFAVARRSVSARLSSESVPRDQSLRSMTAVPVQLSPDEPRELLRKSAPNTGARKATSEGLETSTPRTPMCCPSNRNFTYKTTFPDTLNS